MLKQSNTINKHPVLARKHILITGGTSGLGLSLVKQALEQKCTIDVISKSGLIPKELERYSSEVTFYRKDIGLVEGYETLFESMKPPQIIICNAGVYSSAPITDALDSDIENVIRTNLLGSILTTKYGLSNMDRDKTGVVVFISSTATQSKRPGQSVYTASKAGLSAFAETLRNELSNTAIDVFDVHPGPMQTPIFAKAGISELKVPTLNPDYVAGIIFSNIAASFEGNSIESFTIKKKSKN